MPEITNPTEFDKMYFGSLPQELLDLYANPDYFKALELAKAGFAVDGPIQVNKLSSPYIIMLARKSGGYTWVPKFDQPPVFLGPGLNFPGLPTYDPNNPPSGSIKVSLNSDDYPQRNHLNPILLNPHKFQLVGPLAYANIYYSGPDDNKAIQPGYTFSDERGNFVKHTVSTFGIQNYFWEKI